MVVRMMTPRTCSHTPVTGFCQRRQTCAIGLARRSAAELRGTAGRNGEAGPAADLALRACLLQDDREIVLGRPLVEHVPALLRWLAGREVEEPILLVRSAEDCRVPLLRAQRRRDPNLRLQPGARARLFSLWGMLSVRILTDLNVGSDLRSLLLEFDVCKNPPLQTAVSPEKINARGLGVAVAPKRTKSAC